MDRLTLFGLCAVTAMLVAYALERRSRWFILAFALSCWLASLYGFLQGAWPFGVVEVWFGVSWRCCVGTTHPCPSGVRAVGCAASSPRWRRGAVSSPSIGASHRTRKMMNG